MKRIRKYSSNVLLDIRNTLILGIYMAYFAFILFPVILIFVSINYIMFALVELNWRELKKIPKNTHRMLNKIVDTFD